MFSKKLVAGIFIGAIIAAGAGYFLIEDEQEEVPEVPVVENQVVKPAPQKKSYSKPVLNLKKTNLYNSVDKNIPFSAIANLADMPEGVKQTVNELLEETSGGIYYLKQHGDKLFLITDLTPLGEENPIKRHDFHFIEISASDGSILTPKVQKENDKYDKWEFDNELPLSHIHYDENKNPEYTEVWNYSDEEPIKYKKFDKNGNAISLRKETVDNNINLREEHIFYDEDGKMIKNISFNYTGEDLTRFTYYNSEKPDDSAMLVSEFEDGVKKKENLYSSDYKLQNTYVPEYKDYQKSEIKVLNSDNKVIEILVEQ